MRPLIAIFCVLSFAFPASGCIETTVRRMVEGVQPDKRFVSYLMGATGIVVVPLTGFQCAHHGFRATLLETDDEKRAWILESLRAAIDEYVASGAPEGPPSRSE